MKDRYDVVIVGGGIAGSSLATVLAREGVDVLVLERTTRFVDRVRGEAMMPWGVVESKRTGLYDVFKGLGGVQSETWMQYDEGLPAPFPIPVGAVLPGECPLNVGHPAACQALIETAEDSGAEVVRGVDNVELLRDPNGACFTLAGETHTVRTPLVVGADGRKSNIRDQAGIVMERQNPPGMIAGLLVEPAEPLPEHDIVATEGDMSLLSFLQPQGRTRLYFLMRPEDRDRFTGREGAERFLAATRLRCLPMADALADGRAAGPCATYPGDDAWTAQPFADGVVVIGDAAGYNNPIIGQGLSLSMRDVRLVSEALTGSSQWTTETFRPYAEERLERMRRVRLTANLGTKAFVGFPNDPEGRMEFTSKRMGDPVSMQGFLTLFTGPEMAPAEAFDEDAIDELLRAS
jgi:2-polyprenyl-6-methoxyphenol hydroxylase-like FAD-dependent oxidoreductase